MYISNLSVSEWYNFCLRKNINTGFRQPLKKMDIDVLTSRRAVLETHLDGFASFAQIHGVQTGDQGSGSRGGLLPPSPLRTARTTFTVGRSSLSNALLRTRWCHVQRLAMDLSMAVGMQEHTVVCRLATPMSAPDEMMVVPSRQTGDFLVAHWA